MVSRCCSIRKRKNQSATTLDSHSAQYLATLRLKSTTTFSKKRKRPIPDTPDQPHPKRAACLRTVSEPIPISSPVGYGNFDRQSPASPSHQPIRRCISEPVPESYFPVPPAAGFYAPLPPRSREPSPVAQRVKRLNAMLIQMSKQWEEIIKESSEHGEEAESQSSDQFSHKGDSEASQESGTEGKREESVMVEMNGDRLILRLKCPCGEGCEILCGEEECFYKSASF